MQEGNNIAHSVHGEIVRINREDTAPVHVVWKCTSESPLSAKREDGLTDIRPHGLQRYISRCIFRYNSCHIDKIYSILSV